MKISLKLLTASDLSLFKVHLRLSKQKAINLNSNVFVDQFYPALQSVYDAIPVELSILGPAGKPAHALTRKVLRSPGSKNWRLDGEFIHDIEEDPDRFCDLRAGDYAVLVFAGDERPKAVQLLLVSQIHDTELHDFLKMTWPLKRGQGSMKALSLNDVVSIRGATLISDLVGDDAIQSAHLGLQENVEEASVKKWRRISHADVKRRLLDATDTGRLGEELFNMWLRVENIEAEWVSDEFAYAPLDFIVQAPWVANWDECPVDVKSTRVPNNCRFHLSRNELIYAAANPAYVVARWSGLSSKNALLGLYAGVSDFAANILTVLEQLPEGVKVDSVEVDTVTLVRLFEQQVDLDLLASAAADLDEAATE